MLICPGDKEDVRMAGAPERGGAGERSYATTGIRRAEVKRAREIKKAMAEPLMIQILKIKQ